MAVTESCWMATVEEKGKNALGFEYVHKTENFVYRAKGKGMSDQSNLISLFPLIKEKLVKY